MLKISKYVLYDILRNKIMMAYTSLLFAVCMSLFQMEENASRAVLSILNIVLIAVPLVSIVFATIHWYNSYEFIELMLTQPLSRRKVFFSQYMGIAASLIAAFFIGVGIPVIFFQLNTTGTALVVVGIILTLCFTSFAFLASVNSRDKAKGIGSALLLWLYFTLIYDGLVMIILFSFSDYPLEKIIMVLLSFNPVDLARIFIMLQLDVSALMGVSGAIVKSFMDTNTGVLLTLGFMAMWAVVPLLAALRLFNKKDM